MTLPTSVVAVLVIMISGPSIKSVVQTDEEEWLGKMKTNKKSQLFCFRPENVVHLASEFRFHDSCCINISTRPKWRSTFLTVSRPNKPQC